ncbi:unannotated protein [freshwater metagenome]|uniref:Unannotated protein n=1 Tax=freshwater metagenome TaxID=449393 RepID=A0A6J7SC90_9ZZZZ
MYIRAEDVALTNIVDKAGPIALLFVFALGIALYFIWKSMNRQLKKVDQNIPLDPPLVQDQAKDQ